MIDGSKWWGKAILVFFWGGLSASIVNMAYAFIDFNPYWIAWLVVITNITTVLIKNYFIRPTK